ncbi:MAG: flagellar assembly protein FliW [Campylobacterales bacterium]
MTFRFKAPILGFENIKEVEFKESDDFFATLEDKSGSGLFFTLVNPYRLREYSFDLTPEVQSQLQINENSNLMVYNILALGRPSEESVVNFLAPIVFNCDNQSAAQVVLNAKTHPDFGVAQKLSDFMAAEAS